MDKPRLLDLSFEEMTVLLQNMGQPAYRAKQLFEGLHKGLLPAEITGLSKELRGELAAETTLGGAKIYEKFISKADGTRKYLYLLEDSNIIEGVLMGYSYGNTLCVSTQVGCRMGCSFCASTLGGLVRNLFPGEMLGQVLAAGRDNPAPAGKRSITNIVLMGSGEPLDNYENVLKFLQLVNAPQGMNISMRNISLSTCGLVPEIRRLAGEKLGITLSLSLHGPNDRIRRQIMPVANAYSLEETLAAMRFYVQQTGRRVVFEYALIAGVNDRPAHAEELAERLRGLQCHVNLIPLNTVQERALQGAAKSSVQEFLNILVGQHISATVRREMGVDIAGACGQLRRSILEKQEQQSIPQKEERG